MSPLSKRVVAGLAVASLALSACGQTAQPAPAAPAAKATEPAKPAATAPAAASSPAAASTPAAAKPTDKPAAAASPAASPAVALQPAPAGQALPAATALNQLSGTVRIDGSSTVFPVTEAMAEEFQKATGGRVRVTVGISGTGGGFQKFCNDEIDVSNASRPIRAPEMAACKEKNIQWVEMPVAFDGLSILVSPRNTFVECLTKSELRKMWEPAAQGTITRWNQVRSSFPDQPLTLYGAGTDSGTFDYFTEAINGREDASRGDYTASEDDNVLVQGISNDPNALGYFGYAYYEENKDRLKLLGVDNEDGKGCVKPAPDTITSGAYQPLSRPIFVYGKVAALQRPEVREFLRFYVNPDQAPTLIPQAGYVPFPSSAYGQITQRLNNGQTGTAFGGASTTGVRLDDLFAQLRVP